GWTSMFLGTTRRRFEAGGSDYALLEHRIGDLHEGGNVRAVHVVYRAVRTAAMSYAALVDRLHDRVQPLVDLAVRPAQPLRVLRHLQPRGGDATRIARLAGRVEHPGLVEDVDRLDGARHVRTLGDAEHAVGHQRAGVVLVELVLCCARQRDVDGHVP